MTSPNVALLAWPNLEACRQTAGRPQATADELIRDAAVLCSACARACMRTTRPSPGSSLRFQRAMLMSEPSSIDGN
jgi:feruloyl-CoA synthase